MTYSKRSSGFLSNLIRGPHSILFSSPKTFMEISQFRGFSELSGIEDPCFNSQWPFNSFDDQLNPMNMEAAAFGDITHHLYNSHSPIFDHYKPILEPSPRPTKQPKTSSWNSCITPDNSMMNHNLHYANDSLIANQANLVTPKEEGTVSSKRTFGFACDSNFQASQVQFGNQNHHHGGGGSGGGVKPTTTSNTIRGPATPQDHILAERKRREKLSQRFIALSALVPGLKKVTIFMNHFLFIMDMIIAYVHTLLNCIVLLFIDG